MRRTLLVGAAAGAMGTVALNVVTYLDMAVRGRPSSKVPAKVAGRLAEEGGVGSVPPTGTTRRPATAARGWARCSAT